MTNSHKRRLNGAGCKLRRRITNLGDFHRFLCFQCPLNGPQLAQANRRVHVRPQRTVGVEHVGTSPQNAVSQRFHGTANVLTSLCRDFTQHRIFVGIFDHVCDFDNLSVLLQRHRHVFKLEGVGSRGHTFNKRRRLGGKHLWTTKLHHSAFVFRKLFPHTQLIQYLDRPGVGEHGGFSIDVSPLRNARISGGRNSHGRKSFWMLPASRPLLAVALFVGHFNRPVKLSFWIIRNTAHY